MRTRTVVLSLLLATSGVARASNYALEEVPMLVPADDAARLRAAGVATTFALLEHGGDVHGRKALAASTHIPVHTLETWIRQCDLMRLRGVGPDVARLLTAVGVLTVADLQKADPEKTEQAILRTNEQQKLSENPPSKDHLAAWIAQAKNLPIVLK